MQQQVEKSSLVVEGKVVSKSSFWDADHKMIYTSNTIEVYKVFKGLPTEIIEVITIGGTVGLNALIASNTLKLQKGDIGVFTLYNSNVEIGSKSKLKKKSFRPYGQGKSTIKN